MDYCHTYADLDTRLYNKQPPVPLDNPRAGHFNPYVAANLGWDKDEDLMARWVEILGGQYVPKDFSQDGVGALVGHVINPPSRPCVPSGHGAGSAR